MEKIDLYTKNKRAYEKDYQERQFLSDVIREIKYGNRLPKSLQEQYTYPKPEEQVEEEEKFKTNVSINTDFSSFKIFDEKVVWGGVLKDVDIEFTLDTTLENVLISCNSVILTENLLELLDKLNKYFISWKETWLKSI